MDRNLLRLTPRACVLCWVTKTIELGPQRQLEMHAFGFLQGGQDACEVRRGRAALWAKHAHEAFRRNVRFLLKRLKSYRGVHVVTQHGLAGFEITVRRAVSIRCESRRDGTSWPELNQD